MRPRKPPSVSTVPSGANTTANSAGFGISSLVRRRKKYSAVTTMPRTLNSRTDPPTRTVSLSPTPTPRSSAKALCTSTPYGSAGSR